MKWISQQWGSLSAIDAKWLSFIGDISVALAALGAVVITGIFAIRQYRKEQRERAKDRELEIRKQLMVEGIRGAIKAAQSIAVAGELDVDPSILSKQFQDGISEFSTAMSMATLRTVGLSRNFHRAALRQFLEVAQRRDPLIRLNDEFVVMTRVLQAEGEDNKRMFETQKAIMLGDADVEKIRKAQEMIDSGHKMHSKLAEERDLLWRRLESERGSFAIANLRRMDGFMPELYRVIGSIRMDLGLDGNVENFTRAAALNSKDMKLLMLDVFKALDISDEELNKKDW